MTSRRWPPAGIVAALEQAKRVQEIVTGQLKTGRTGNQVLAASLEQMRGEGIKGSVYSHPVGDHGHGSGPLIGLWDRQEGVDGEGRARWVLRRQERYHLIELAAENVSGGGME